MSAALVGRAAGALPAAATPVWLAPGRAADLCFAPPLGADNGLWAEVLRNAIGAAPIDVVVQAAAGRRKSLLVADMDSTLIRQECVDELADAAGLRDAVAAITERSMRGEIDFEASLRERVWLLRGLDVAIAARIVIDRIVMMPGARTVARTMRRNGALTAIASGGFTIFTAFVARTLGFERHYANTLVVEGGRLTGTLREPVLGRTSKRDILQALSEECGASTRQTLAVGDGANDLAMLASAGLGVAFHAKPAVAAAAHARIEHGDLTALLYLQGYREAEFVT